jgi:hypothetical protein
LRSVGREPGADRHRVDEQPDDGLGALDRRAAARARRPEDHVLLAREGREHQRPGGLDAGGQAQVVLRADGLQRQGGLAREVEAHGVVARLGPLGAARQLHGVEVGRSAKALQPLGEERPRGGRALAQVLL